MAEQRFVNKRKLQHQQTLENIRSAVDALVAEKGFDAMTIRDICNLAGIKIGGFYHHFSSKDDLLFDRYHRMNQYFEEFYQTQLAEKPAAQALHLAVDRYFYYLRSRVFSMMLKYQLTFTANRQAWEAREENVWHSIIYRLLEQGQQNRQLRTDVCAADLADFLHCLIQGATQSYCSSGGTFLEQSNIEKRIHQWIDCLKP